MTSLARQLEDAGVDRVERERSAAGQCDLLAWAGGSIGPRAVGVAPVVLDSGFGLSDEEVIGQRGNALVAGPLQAAIVFLGRARQHLDDDRRIRDYVARSRLERRRATDRDVGIHIPSVRRKCEPLVGAEDRASVRAQHGAEFGSHTHGEGVVPRRPSRHGEDLAVEELVLDRLLAFPGEILGGGQARTLGDATHTSRLPCAPRRALPRARPVSVVLVGRANRILGLTTFSSGSGVGRWWG